MTLKNHASVPIRKKRLSPASHARRPTEISLSKSGMPDWVESFIEKSIVARIVQESSFSLLNQFEMDWEKNRI